jgi:hypothetical protein
MGIGLVLLFWIIFFGCAGLPVAVGLAYWSWRNGRRANSASKARAFAAGLLPFILIALGLIWFFAYAAYSWSVRKVDPGLGDTWAVPLRNGYFFCMIDVTEHGYLMKGGCSGAPPVHSITALAEVGDAIVGSSAQSGAFVFDTRTDGLKRYPDVAAALDQFAPPPKLQPPDEFYRSRRFGWQDVAALVLLLASVAMVSWVWFKRLVRAPAAVAANGRV